MKRRKTYIVMAVLLAVLVLGIGYAAVLDIELNIGGTANINANFDFDVVFDTSHTITYSSVTGNDASISGSYTDTENATLSVTLDTDNRELFAIFKVDNNSDELSATLDPYVTQITVDENDETVSQYFGTITAVFYTDASCTAGNELSTNKVAAGSSAYLKVTVPMSTTDIPVDDVVGAEFNVQITASPAEIN